jgi:ubiquinol-cytochrome c reductase cytochrome b subunit
VARQSLILRRANDSCDIASPEKPAHRDDKGGQRGPALDSVALRLTADQLIRQVIQGGGTMPAYGKNLSPAETTALVAFLKTLHPASQPPARDASRAIALGASEVTPR